MTVDGLLYCCKNRVEADTANNALLMHMDRVVHSYLKYVSGTACMAMVHVACALLTVDFISGRSIAGGLHGALLSWLSSWRTVTTTVSSDELCAPGSCF